MRFGANCFAALWNIKRSLAGNVTKIIFVLSRFWVYTKNTKNGRLRFRYSWSFTITSISVFLLFSSSFIYCFALWLRCKRVCVCCNIVFLSSRSLFFGIVRVSEFECTGAGAVVWDMMKWRLPTHEIRSVHRILVLFLCSCFSVRLIKFVPLLSFWRHMCVCRRCLSFACTSLFRLLSATTVPNWYIQISSNIRFNVRIHTF